MKLTLEMELDNDVMLNDGEIVACLQQVGRTIEASEDQRHARTLIRDSNGNTIGHFTVS